MKIGIFTGATGVRLKNIFTDIFQYPTAEHEIIIFSLTPDHRFDNYFCLSPLQKHEGKVVGGFGKKSFVSTGKRKPGNKYASLTAMI